MESFLPELTTVGGVACDRAKNRSEWSAALPAWLPGNVLTAPDVLSGFVEQLCWDGEVPVEIPLNWRSSPAKHLSARSQSPSRHVVDLRSCPHRRNRRCSRCRSECRRAVATSWVCAQRQSAKVP